MRSTSLLVVALLLSGLASCARDEPEEAAVTIEEAKAMHVAELMSLPGVVSVGIGLDEAGHRAILIGLDRPRGEDDVLPDSLEGHPVVVQVIGEIRAQ